MAGTDQHSCLDDLVARVEAAVRSARAEQAQRRYTEEVSQAYRELREVRAEVMLQHQLTGLGVLAAGIAHEMNSPLAALIASLEFAMCETAPAEKEGALTDSLSAARRIAELVRRMSAIASDGERTIKKVDVHAKAAQVCAALADANVTFALSGPSVVIEAVDGEVRDALTALVENAIQATQGRPERKVAVDVGEADDNVVVTVDDNGPGIEERDMPFLFDPFFTRKRVWKTAGLGLAIAQAAARRHGGEVNVEARGPLGGARLCLTLPRSSTPSSGANSVRPILAELRGQ